jgi:hypothetical protein
MAKAFLTTSNAAIGQKMDFAKGSLISSIGILLIGSLFIISVSYAGDLDGPPRYCHDEKKFKPQKTMWFCSILSYLLVDHSHRP